MEKNFALVIVGLPVQGPFDYAIDPAQRNVLQEGMRVRVMFNGRRRVGFIVGFRETTEVKKVLTIMGPLENQASVTPEVQEWTKVVAQHYGCSWGEIWELIYPSALRNGKYVSLPKRTLPSLTKRKCHTRLVTGFQLSADSNDLWLKNIATEIKDGHSVLIIVPDKYYADYFKAVLSNETQYPVLALDKRTKVAEQVDVFVRIYQGHPSVIIGTRSSIFIPHPNLGQILLVHEEHDWHKSEQSPHYRTSQVALSRSAVEGVDVTFLSCNPRIELYQKAKREGWEVKSAENQAVADVQLVDLTNYNPSKSSILSFPVQNLIRQTLPEGGRVLLFYNRRGFMTFTKCQQCGASIKCPRCDTHLVLRHNTGDLSCHACKYTSPQPKKCPECASPLFRSSGWGIDKIESDAHRFFPEAKIAVLDKDTQALPKRANLLLATSAIFNFQGRYMADYVVMLDFDQAFYHADFRTSHRSFTNLNLLRRLAKHKFVIQTRMPDDPAIKALQKRQPESFWKSELDMRRELDLPPFTCAATLIVRGKDDDKVWASASAIHGEFAKHSTSGVEPQEPYPDLRPKLRDQYRYNIMLRSSNHDKLMSTIQNVLKPFRSSRHTIVTVDVDP